MNHQEIKNVLNNLLADVNSIKDQKVLSMIKTMVALVEMLAEQNFSLRADNQQLRDEIKRLKGEQGKPNIRAQSKTGPDNSKSSNHSSEADRNKQKIKNTGKSKKNILIDRRVTITLDKASLPNDIKFKGYETRIIQDIKITTDNVEFKLEVYYSPSLQKTFIAPMPAEYQGGGEFGPGIQALVIALYRDSGMTESAIERLLKIFGTQISHGKIAALLTEGHDIFHQEKEDIVDAGQQVGQYQQLDDTGCRVRGKNHYTHVLCNDFFTAYFTRPRKDRLTLLELLCRGQLQFMCNSNALALMNTLGLKTKWHDAITQLFQSSPMHRDDMEAMLDQLFPDPKQHQTNRRIVLEAAALTYYQQSPYFINHLITDDAPQFNLLAQYRALCWIHEGRHYKKLNPVTTHNQNILDEFQQQFWSYYQDLLTYKTTPSPEMALALAAQFDKLFTTTTGYEALDQRIASTHSNKSSLLLVLAYPFLPLHNNASELGARMQARIRDINFHTMSANGTKCKDTFCTIVQTARKLGVNLYQYIYDRVSRKFAMTSLANMILLQAECLPKLE